MTHLAFELRTNTPDALTAELAERGPARDLVDAAIAAF
jgi:hypothetical protein